MSFQDMVEFLDISYCAKNYIVPCLIGPVGIGKTAACKQHAENVGAKRVVEIIASQVLPTEISGIKMPDLDKGIMRVLDDERLAGLEDGDILFFDELFEADQMVLSACLTLIENRTMLSGRKLPDIQIVAATNKTVKPGILKASIRQRFLFKEVTYDPIEICNHIAEVTGLMIPHKSIENNIQSDIEEYNILSPRSLTKAVKWFMDCKNNLQRKQIEKYLNNLYSINIGSLIMLCFEKQFNINEVTAREEILNAVATCNTELSNQFDWKNDDLDSIMKILKESDEWNEIQAILESVPIK